MNKLLSNDKEFLENEYMLCDKNFVKEMLINKFNKNSLEFFENISKEGKPLISKYQLYNILDNSASLEESIQLSLFINCKEDLKRLTTFEFFKRLNKPQHIYEMQEKYSYVIEFKEIEKDPLKEIVGNDVELILKILKYDVISYKMIYPDRN